MGDRDFWGSLAKRGPFWLGVTATTIMLASAMGILSFATAFGKGCALLAAVLNAYGIHGVATWTPPREPWSPERKLQESIARLARGEAPLVGYEFLLQQQPPTAPDNRSGMFPVSPPVPPPLPPVDPDPKKGA
jgi:hypothetical protein